MMNRVTICGTLSVLFFVVAVYFVAWGSYLASLIALIIGVTLMIASGLISELTAKIPLGALGVKGKDVKHNVVGKKKIEKNKTTPKDEAPYICLEAIKSKIRILLIDDNDDAAELVQLLKNEGWHSSHMMDLNSYEDSILLDSHIICIDINGVGKALHRNSGLDLVEPIGQRYPQKKIILYSSEPNHRIFDAALDYVDRRVSKTDTYSFSKSIEQLAIEIFDKEANLESVYLKFKKHFKIEIKYSQLKLIIEHASDNGVVDFVRLSKELHVDTRWAKAIAEICNYRITE